jgi:hypothetical protein
MKRQLWLMYVWEPWKWFEEVPAGYGIVKLDEPPCKYCIHWRPYRTHDGVVCCAAEEMCRDFSCFKSKEELPNQ